MTIRLPFEWLVALRYLREGRMQTALILSGVVGGVAVIVFLTHLITQLQASIIERTLGAVESRDAGSLDAVLHDDAAARRHALALVAGGARAAS